MILNEDMKTLSKILINFNVIYVFYEEASSQFGKRAQDERSVESSLAVNLFKNYNYINLEKVEAQKK